jgi:hypothetical protein
MYAISRSAPALEVGFYTTLAEARVRYVAVPEQCGLRVEY